MGEETTAGAIVRYLHELKDLLEAAGFTAVIELPHGAAPGLRVGNRHAPILSETIRIDRLAAEGDALWFFFSWGGTICPARDSREASRKITNVLSNR